MEESKNETAEPATEPKAEEKQKPAKRGAKKAAGKKPRTKKAGPKKAATKKAPKGTAPRAKATESAFDVKALKKLADDTIGAKFGMKSRVSKNYLADRLGVSAAALTGWEKGKTTPSAKSLKKLRNLERDLRAGNLDRFPAPPRRGRKSTKSSAEKSDSPPKAGGRKGRPPAPRAASAKSAPAAGAKAAARNAGAKTLVGWTAQELAAALSDYAAGVSDPRPFLAVISVLLRE